MLIVAHAEEVNGEFAIKATMSDFERYLQASRGSVIRALAALERSGFCRVNRIRGGGGATSIVVLDGRAFTRSSVAGHIAPEYSSGSASQDAELTTESDESAKLSFVLERPPDHSTDHPGQTRTSQVVDPSSTQIQSRARDLDLLRSPKKDPGDPDLPENITSLYVPTPESEDSANQQQSQIELFNKPIAVIKAKAIQSKDPADPPKRAAKKVDADKITARAWMAADYLRRHVLVRNPVAVASRSQWEYGWSWNTGKPAMVGEGSRTGMRLKWAHDLLKFHGKLRAALAGGGQPSTDEYAWDLIARTIHWLFNGQKNEPRYQVIVDSPGSLIEKWDRIQLKRTSDQAQPVRQTAAVTAETIIRPKYVDEPPAGVNRRRP